MGCLHSGRAATPREVPLVADLGELRGGLRRVISLRERALARSADRRARGRLSALPRGQLGVS